MKQKAEFKICGNLKKTSTETYEVLKSSHGEECLSRTNVFEWQGRFKERLMSLQGHERMKTVLTAFFGALCTTNLYPRNTVNSKFYKRVNKRLVTPIYKVRPEFQESGTVFVCFMALVRELICRPLRTELLIDLVTSSDERG
jgi:hypothetical protein